MRFWRKKPPDGKDVSPEFEAGMRTMEEWYHEFVIWAYAYISLLEKMLQDRDKDRCGKCKHCDNESNDVEDHRTL